MKKITAFKSVFKSFIGCLLSFTILFSCAEGLLRVSVPKTAFAAGETAEEGTMPKNPEQEGITRPDELMEGLSRKSFDDVNERRVTIRQPIMEVEARGLKRKEPEVLDDTVTLMSLDEARTEYEKVKVTFDGDTETVPNTTPDPKYPRAGLDGYNSSNGKNRYFTNFEKYMLLRQAEYYNKWAMKDAAEGKLKKHPAADGIYGAIPVEDNAVRKHIVTDPTYRSPLTTGLYLPAGEVATVKVKGLGKNEKLTLYTHQQDSLAYSGYDENGSGFSTVQEYYNYWDTRLIQEAEKDDPNFESVGIRLQGQWERQNQKVPRMGAEFVITEDGDYSIGSIYGGPLYLKPTDSCVDLVIEGAVETPHFILGVTTVDEFENHLRKAPGLIATLDVENGQLIGPAKDMAVTDDILKLAYFWHSVFTVNASFNGRAYNYNITMAYDLHVPAGEAVALNSGFCAQPTYWFPRCMNYYTMTHGGNWGTLHELGHIHANAYGTIWGMREDKEGEVRNNMLIVLIYTMLCNMDNRLERLDDHGEFTHAYTTLQKSLTVRDKTTYDDYSDLDYFEMISLYANLIHAFGGDKFVDFFYTYHEKSAYCTHMVEKNGKQLEEVLPRADFIYRIALVDHVNIFDWLNSCYFANVTKDQFTTEQWEYLRSLPDFYPVAYEWGNGIDGNETARKYEVDGTHPTEFDFSGSHILCPVEHEILSISQPVYGKITVSDDKTKAEYIPPEDVTESDEFAVKVRVKSRVVTLNVRFNLTYKGAYTEVWNITEEANAAHKAKPSVQEALGYVNGREPDATMASTTAGVPQFNKQGVFELYHVQFRFRAPEAGSYTFGLRSDDCATVHLKKADGTENATIATTDYANNYNNNPQHTYTMSEGELLDVDAYVVNFGGQGFLYVGVILPGETAFVPIPKEYLVSPDVTEEELKVVEDFPGWQPEFLVSIKNATIDRPAEKEGWKVIEAPKGQIYDDGPSDPQLMVDGIDGDNNTSLFHSKWSGGGYTPMPHTYVIDTLKTQAFNYVDIVRRPNGNSVIYEMEIWIGKEDLTKENAVGEYTKVFDGTATYNGLHAMTRFENTEGRFIKIVIRSAAGGHFTVINEIYAGVNEQLAQPVKPDRFLSANDGFEESAANGKLSAKKASSSFEFEFLGTGFAVFSDMAPDFGSARVTVDGEPHGIIDLNGPTRLNTLVYAVKDLDLRQHTVRIETVDEKPFNVGFINVDYGVPVEEGDYPAVDENYGDETPLEFSAGWKTYVPDYRELTSIDYVRTAPEGYTDTYVRFATYIRLYRGGTGRIAFVYPGDILAPADSSNLFAGCAKLTHIGFTNFSAQSVASANGMFRGCASLETVDLTGLSFENAVTLSYMFRDCTSLSSVEMKTVRAESAELLNSMFEGCTSLTSVSLPQGATVRDMSALFRGCTALETADFGGSSLGEKVDLEGLFADCDALTSVTAPESFSGSASLPGLFEDTTGKTFSEEMASANAGHTLTKHAEHTHVRVEAVKATCTDAGTKEHMRCACGHITDLEGHEITEASLTVEPLGHEWSDWTVTKKATASVPGEEERHCSRDVSHVETEEIPAGGNGRIRNAHGGPDGTSDGGAPVLPIVLGVAGGAAALAAIAAVAFVVLRKKRR